MCNYFNQKFNHQYHQDAVLISEVMKDKNQQSRCFGFVEFNEFVDARQLINNQPHFIDGKVVECKLAVPKDPIKDDKKRKKKKF